VALVAAVEDDSTRLAVAAYDPETDACTRADPPVRPKHPRSLPVDGQHRPDVVLWSMWDRSERIRPNAYTRYAGIDGFRESDLERRVSADLTSRKQP
jgi:hypothetical protein